MESFLAGHLAHPVSCPFDQKGSFVSLQAMHARRLRQVLQSRSCEATVTLAKNALKFSYSGVTSHNPRCFVRTNR